MTQYLLPLILLGGFCAMDVVTFPQAMISRPLAACTLTGLIFGAPQEGILVGVLLELIALETMPFGAARYLEWGSASVAGAAIMVAATGPVEVRLLLSLLAALAVAFCAGASMVALRRLNGKLAAGLRERLEAGSASTIYVLQGTGLALDFSRGAVITVAAFVLLSPAAAALAPRLAESDILSLSGIAFVPAAAAMVATWRMFGSGSRRRWIVLAGAVIGVLLAL